MRRLRRIKILATLGPASSDLAMIRRLFEAGADLFRINMSHTPHDKMRELVATIRNVESSYGRPIGILVDLQGPKLRLGSFAEGAIQLQNGQTFTLDSDKTPGDATRVQLPHPEILAALRPGHALLLDDGKVRLIAEETSKEHAVTRVVVGGKMSDRKGRQPARHRPAGLGDDAQGPRRPRGRPRHRRRLDRAVLRAARRRRDRG
ncbi:pyruvate kinase [Bradyrhizobium yuanmingense]